MPPTGGIEWWVSRHSPTSLNPQTVEHGPPCWREGSAQAEAHLDDPAAPQVVRAGPRPRDVQLDAKLRGCDLVKLRLSDVVQCGTLRERSVIVQQKTGRPVPFELTAATRHALRAWLDARGSCQDDWLFPSRMRPGDHISTRQYARLVDGWVSRIELNPAEYGAYSLRRTKVALIYKKTGNLRACQLLLGHGKLESTVPLSGYRGG